MAGHAAVGVDDDLAAGEAGVAHRATDLEATGGVDERTVGADVEVGAALTQLGQDRVDHVGLDVGLEHALEGHVGRVLRRQHHGVEPDGTVAVVGDGDLRLAVGPQVGELLALADLGQSLRETVREVDRQRHELGGVVAGVPEHQALVAGALLVELVLDVTGAVLVRRVDALRDVGRLCADGDGDTAGAAVEALLRPVVAHVEDGLAHELGDLDVARRRHLAGHVHEPGRDQGLDRDPGVLVLRQQGVEDRVADLVTDLVGVALGDGLGREQTCGHLLSLARVRGGGGRCVRWRRGRVWGVSLVLSPATVRWRPRGRRRRRPWWSGRPWPPRRCRGAGGGRSSRPCRR